MDGVSLISLHSTEKNSFHINNVLLTQRPEEHIADVHVRHIIKKNLQHHIPHVVEYQPNSKQIQHKLVFIQRQKEQKDVQNHGKHLKESKHTGPDEGPVE